MDTLETKQPWTLRWRAGRRFGEWAPGAVAYVHFRHRGRRRAVSAGACSPGEAPAACAKVYADAVDETPEKHERLTPARKQLSGFVSRWVISNVGVAEPETVQTFELYGRRFVRSFDGIESLVALGRIRAYARDRLREAVVGTVKRELSGLRSFARWCVDEGVFTSEPGWLAMKVSALLPKKAAGTRTGAQRAEANKLTPAQVAALLAALPERSEGGSYPVRARFVFAYETGLRPATIDQMLQSDLVQNGAAVKIRDEIDKSNYGRIVPLSARAVAAVESIASSRTPGLWAEGDAEVFGRHDFRADLAAASAAAGLPFKAAPYDLRHARATHWMEEGVPLGVVAFLLGHRLVTTTNKYVHPSGRTAREWLNRPAPPISGDRPPRPEPGERVARFGILQPTRSFPGGAPLREYFQTDTEQLLAARIYAHEWRAQYECAGCELPDCPQHGVLR